MSDAPKTPITNEDLVRAIHSLTAATYAVDRKNDVFDSDDPDEEDVGAHFARLHSKVTSAFESWDAGAEPGRIFYVDAGGEEAPAGAGLPTGMPIDMADIVLDVLSLCRLLRIDAGRAIVEGLRGRSIEEEDDPDPEEADDEESPTGGEGAVTP